MQETKQSSDVILTLFEAIEAYINKKEYKVVLYPGKVLNETDLDMLDLSVRSSNCLKRAGCHTVGDLVAKIKRREDLMKIRNLGNNSADEIITKLCTRQYEILDEKNKTKYLKILAERNGLDLK